MLRLLVVDDDEDLRLLFSVEFSASGRRIEEASSGEEAVELARETMYDAIFMDYNMAGINGLEAIRQIREFNTTTPVYLYSTAELREEGSNLGIYPEDLSRVQATGYVQKDSKARGKIEIILKTLE
tara:strand:- start:1091 stop:1468 length:378 start_codon:yes stop_codon:yes gene_type:complete